MFPYTGLGRIALAFGTLMFTLALALPPVSLCVSDLGMAYHGKKISLVGDHTQRGGAPNVLHFGGCKFVGESGVCVHKELSYDRAHGLHLSADVSSRSPSGIQN